MTTEGQIIGESDFKIIDEKELEIMKRKGKLGIKDDLGSSKTDDINILGNQDEIESGNLKDDLIKLGLLDYENMSDEEKKIFDELEQEKRDKGYYELD